MEYVTSRKFVLVRLGKSWKPEILHEHALLVNTYICILGFQNFQNSPKSFPEKFHCYLPHMEYEGSIGLVMRFEFLGLFMNK
jgi:hypothetical protein